MKMKTLIIFFLLCSVCFAQEKVKPNIDETKILSKAEQDEVKEYLGGKIFKKMIPAKNDYKNRFDKGTVAYTPENRNYAYTKVIIPNGTVIKNSNFAQRKAYTDSISGNNLTFISCNLTNVLRNPTWTLITSSNTQIERKIKKQTDLGDGRTKLEITHKVYNPHTDKFEETGIDEKILDNSTLADKLLYFAE